jgi:hypothetical protein
MGISFPKEIITVNVLSSINAMQALRGGIFLPILNSGWLILTLHPLEENILVVFTHKKSSSNIKKNRC